MKISNIWNWIKKAAVWIKDHLVLVLLGIIGVLFGIHGIKNNKIEKQKAKIKQREVEIKATKTASEIERKTNNNIVTAKEAEKDKPLGDVVDDWNSGK